MGPQTTKNTWTKRRYSVLSMYDYVLYGRIFKADIKIHQYIMSYPVQNGPTRSKTVQNGSKRSETIQNGSKRFKTVQNFFPAVYQSTDQNDHSTPFSNRKIRKKIKTVLNIVWTVLMHDPTSDESVFNAFLGHFFQSKAWIPWIFWKFWPLLATSGHFWPLLATSSHFWSLLATFLSYNLFRGNIINAVEKRQLSGRNTTVRRGRGIVPLINQSIESSHCVTQWRIEWSDTAHCLLFFLGDFALRNLKSSVLFIVSVRNQ